MCKMGEFRGQFETNFGGEKRREMVGGPILWRLKAAPKEGCSK